MARVASEAGVIHQPHHHFGLHRRSAGGDDQAASPFALLIEGTDTPARQPAAKDDGPPPSSTSAAAETRTTSGEATDKTKANLDGALEAAIVTGDQTAELPVQPVAAGGLTQTGDVTNAQCADVIAASEQLGQPEQKDDTATADAAVSLVVTPNDSASTSGPAAPACPTALPALAVPTGAEPPAVTQAETQDCGARSLSVAPAGTVAPAVTPKLNRPVLKSGEAAGKDGVNGASNEETPDMDISAAPELNGADAAEAHNNVAPPSADLTATRADGSPLTVKEGALKVHTASKDFAGPHPHEVLTRATRATAGQSADRDDRNAGQVPADGAPADKLFAPRTHALGPVRVEAQKPDEILNVSAQAGDPSRGANPTVDAPRPVLQLSENSAASAPLSHSPIQNAADAVSIPIAGLAIEIAARAQAGRNRFEIRLDPPELGRIDVRLDVDRSGQVTSRLVVERADTLEHLRRDAGDLQRALQDAGLKTADNSLQFSLRDQSFAGRDRFPRPDVARIVAPQAGLATEQNMQANYDRTAWTRGGVDIRV